MIKKVGFVLIASLLLGGLCACYAPGPSVSEVIEPSVITEPSVVESIAPPVVTEPTVSEYSAPPIVTEEDFIMEDGIRLSVDFPVYPPQEVSETVVELVRLAQRLIYCNFDFSLWKGNGQINIEWYDIMLFISDPFLWEYSMDTEEYERYLEKYDMGAEGFVDIDIVDRHYYDIIATTASNITPAYRENATIEDGRLLWYGTVHADGLFIPVLKEQAITDDKMELTFGMLLCANDTLHGRSEYGDSGTGWSDPIGRVEDDEYILFRNAEESMAYHKYTFVFEDGKYKIYSIKLA